MARTRYAHRSPEAQAYQRLYKTKRWQLLRRQKLAVNPLCERCATHGRVVAAGIVHHLEPHKGDPVKFFEGPLQSLCAPCHDSHAQSEERLGYSTEIGMDGWPVDDKHPFHASTATRRWGYSIPHGVLPSRVRVHLVCGAPGSGKTTFVRAHAKRGDLIIDMDDILESLGYPRYSSDWSHRKAALRERDRMIRSLAGRSHGEAWLIVTAPSGEERQQWTAALGKVVLHAIETDPGECRRRIENDPARQAERARLLLAVDRYFDTRG